MRVRLVPRGLVAVCVSLLVSLLVSPAVSVGQTDAAGAASQGGHGPRTRVQLLIFDPVLRAHGSGRLSNALGWNDPDGVTDQLINSLHGVSHGETEYDIVDRQEIDEWPVLADGFAYTEDSWFGCWSDHANCHSPFLVDYLRILNEHHSCDLRNDGVIDEVWLWGAPFFGYFESTLTGPRAFWLNSPPLMGSRCQRLLPIMGFNYERTIAEAMHSYGHRIESAMDFAYGYAPGSPWRRFSTFDLQSPGQAGCGNVHFPPNGVADYDYSNPTTVLSDCSDWSTWPTPPSHFVPVSCVTWSCTQYGYLTWWMNNIPHAKAGRRTDRIENNWWHYILIDARSTRQTWKRLFHE